MIRRLFNLLVGLSLLLLAAELVFWAIAREFPCTHVSMRWDDSPKSTTVHVESIGWDESGFFECEDNASYNYDQDEDGYAARDRAARVQVTQKLQKLCPPSTNATFWAPHRPKILDLGRSSSSGGGSSHNYTSYLDPVERFAALPLLWCVVWFWNRKRARVAARRGCCTQCGYDLRATPDRCPECGTLSLSIRRRKARALEKW